MGAEVLLLINGFFLVLLLFILLVVAFRKPQNEEDVSKDIEKIKSQIANK